MNPISIPPGPGGRQFYPPRPPLSPGPRTVNSHFHPGAPFWIDSISVFM